MKDLREKEKNLEKVPQPDRKELEDASQVIKDEIKAKLDEYSERIDELEKKRKSIQDGISSKDKEQRAKRQELNDMKKKIGFQSEAEIDSEIRKIETKMCTESHTLKQEKEMMARIQELRKSKPTVTKLAAMEGATPETGEVDNMKNNIDDIKKELIEVREAKKIQSQAYSTLMEARQKVMGDVPKMFEERETINAKIREKIMERNALRDAFNTEQRAFSLYLNEARALRGERARLEREGREKEWEEGPKALPFADDLMYLENMINHLKALLPKEAAEEEKKEDVAVDAPAGNMVLMMKNKREEEFFFAPTKKKQLKKKGGAKAKPLVHSMETLSFFEKYKIPTPPDATAVPDAITAVEGKVKEFQEKQTKEVEKMKKKAEGKEEKAEEAPAAE